MQIAAKKKKEENSENLTFTTVKNSVTNSGKGSKGYHAVQRQNKTRRNYLFVVTPIVNMLLIGLDVFNVYANTKNKCNTPLFVFVFVFAFF